MDLLNAIVLPIAFGLLGFITPCSLGADIVLLGYISGRQKRERLVLAGGFTLVRALFLSLLGISFAYLGQIISSFIMAYNSFLGIAFIILGAAIILGQFKQIPFPRFAPLRNPGPRGGLWGAIALAIVFGVTIPACISPLLIVLLAKTVFLGRVSIGFFALFIFGFSMSLPLLLLSFSEKANRILFKLRRTSKPAAFIAGGLLILVGVLEYSPAAMMFMFSLPGRVI